MFRTRMVAGLTGVVVLAVGMFCSFRVGTGHPDQSSGHESKAILLSSTLVGLEITLGIKDTEQLLWEGDLRVTGGKVLELKVVRSGRRSQVDGSRFTVQTAQTVRKGKAKRKNPKLAPAVLWALLDAPSSASITLTTPQGPVEFAIGDLGLGTPKSFLNGQVSIERHSAAQRLTGRSTEDDFPALAKGTGGEIWLTYVEYTPHLPRLDDQMDQISKRNFDSMVPRGNGDRILLRKFDGKSWLPPIDVTQGGLDVWRPTVAVDGNGDVVVAWAQQQEGNWDIHYRRYTPKTKKWSDTVPVTADPGSDFHVVSVADSQGTVWLAWQAWRSRNFEILATALTDDRPRGDARYISSSNANDWSPAIAADSKGHVYVAWDTYAAGNYDVQLREIGNNSIAIPIADSLRFEARPSLACDAEDRLWIAYELGDQQWGKDYIGEAFEKVGLAKDPGGFGLYVNRTIAVKCLSDGKLERPAAELEPAFEGTLDRGKSLPRLGFDGAGGLWMLLRHHPQKSGGGETWVSFSLRYDGRRWSKPLLMPNSSNILDNRPALAAFEDGLLAVYSSDTRTRSQNRDQDDLFSTVLHPDGKTFTAKLVLDQPAQEEKIPAVHENESDDIARIRNFRVSLGGKELRLLRGEFHRHTEYTSHRDQDGLLEDAWRYSQDAGNLDWMGDGDHDNGFGHEYLWWQIQKITDLFHHPPHFVAAQTYERSVKYPSGHRNVMFPRRGIRPLPRLGQGQEILYGTEQEGSPDIKMLYDYLKYFGGICASHTSGTGMGTDWRDNDPDVEPIVEIYQGHRNNYEHFGAPRSATENRNIGGYRPAGSVWNALGKGLRLGFQSSSDHVSTHMSYAIVLTDDASRQGIIDAFKRRHCYGATDNIVLVVRSGEHLMGDVFKTSDPPTLQITVRGTSPIAKLHVVRDNEYVFTSEPEPNQKDVTLNYTDASPKPGQTSYYYVRVDQTDGNLAWASPMWITYEP